MARTFRNFAHVAGPLLLSLLPFAAATVAHPAAAAGACAERSIRRRAAPAVASGA